jgi:hypothetical protein
MFWRKKEVKEVGDVPVPELEARFAIVSSSGEHHQLWAYRVSSSEAGFVKIFDIRDNVVAVFYRPISLCSVSGIANASDATCREAKPVSTEPVGLGPAKTPDSGQSV